MEVRRKPSMETKVCTQCKEDKPIDQYHKQVLTRHSMCYECKREYNKKRYAKQKKLKQEFNW